MHLNLAAGLEASDYVGHFIDLSHNLPWQVSLITYIPKLKCWFWKSKTQNFGTLVYTRHAFLDFGQGPRNCIGMRFALMEAKLGLANIFRRFNLNLSKKMSSHCIYTYPQTGIIFVKGGLNDEKRFFKEDVMCWLDLLKYLQNFLHFLNLYFKMCAIT